MDAAISATRTRMTGMVMLGGTVLTWTVVVGLALHLAGAHDDFRTGAAVAVCLLALGSTGMTVFLLRCRCHDRRQIIDELVLHEQHRDQTQRELDDARRRKRAILDNIPDAAWLKDDRGQFIAVNEPFERAAGMSADRIIGRTDLDVWPEDLARSYMADDAEVIRTGNRKSIDEPMAIDGGERIWIETVRTPVFDDRGRVIGTTGIARDITARRLAEEALRESEARFRAVVDNVGIGIALIDGGMRVRSMNRQMAEWFPDVPACGEPVCYRSFNSPPRETPCGFCPAIKTLSDGHTHEAVTQTPTPDGGTRCYRIVASPVTDADGRVSGVVKMVEDVTERRQAEQALQKAKQAAESANNAKSEFLANMSHEIRTPLTAVLGFADLLMDAGHEAQERDQWLSAIQRNGRHLLELINDILDISRIEAGRLKVSCEPCDPAAIITSVVSMMRVRAREQGIDLSVRHETALPIRIRSDEPRLRQILINLVGNAIKFTEEGSVTIATRFLPKWREGRPGLRIEVIDTGVGMSPQDLERVGRPFFQADGSDSRQHSGTGLGLAICRRIIEALHGEMEVASRPGKGSRFTVTVPTGSLAGVGLRRQPVEPLEGERVGSPATAVDPTALRGVDLLLAEDGPDNQRLISALLTRAGAQVTAVANGREAVNAARSRPFDVILMDMQMPEMDGYHATRVLREQGYDGPVVALTAHALSGARRRCLSAGCCDYLVKPIDRGLLIETVARHARGNGKQDGNGQRNGDGLPPAHRAPVAGEDLLRQAQVCERDNPGDRDRNRNQENRK